MEPQEPPRKRRSLWLAGLGNLFLPPLGHVYAGQPGRGLLLLVGVSAIEAMSIWVAARSSTMRAVVLVFVLSLAGVLWRMADAMLAARWQGSAPLRRYQRWYVYLATALFAVGFTRVSVFGVIRPFLAQAYYIPAGSMIPTLTFGDRILVDRLTYRWKDPERGDVVVFRAPPQASPEQADFVKRIIGLPGETVAVVPDTLLVDGKPAVAINDNPGSTTDTFVPVLQHGVRWVDREHAPQVQDNLLMESGEPRVTVAPSGQAEQHGQALWVHGQRVAYLTGPDRVRVSHNLTPFTLSGIHSSAQGTVYYLPQSDQPALIVLRGHQLALRHGYVSVSGQPLKEPYAGQSPRYEMPPYRVPPGDYFVLGDNRNDSNDSHAWGPVSRDRIAGVTHMIFWADQPERIGRRL